MKCQSRIWKEYKSRKADPVWPETHDGPITVVHGTTKLITELPICGGDVVVTLVAANEPYMGGTYASLEAKFTCSRCKLPWIPKRFAIEGAAIEGVFDLTPYLED